MPVDEAQVQAVVSEVSQRMSDPSYAQTMVGAFVQSQPTVGRYLSARGPKIGGGEAVVHIAFHAEVLSDCLRRAHGRALPTIGFDDLDAAAQGDSEARFAEAERALASYVASNVDDAPIRLELCRIGLALVSA